MARRDFMKSALMIGGVGAMASAEELIGLTGAAGDRLSFAARDNRQHSWNAFLPTDDRGLVAPPSFHVLLFMTYQRDGTPRLSDRFEMEAALRQLERAFEWSGAGLLFTTNYGNPYFERFGESLPDGASLLDNQSSIDAMIKRDSSFENPENPVAEPYDVFIDLASNNVANILAAEEALFGNRDEINGVKIEHTLEGFFDKPTSFPDRRTGFVGIGVAGNNTEQTQQFEEFGNPNPDIDEKAGEDAFLTMGFMSGHEDNQPAEDDVTLAWNQQTIDGTPRPPGAFAQGTVQHASRLAINLDNWYGSTDTGRSAQMFSPFHSTEETGPTGLALGANSSPDEFPMRDEDSETDVARETEITARELREDLEAAGGITEETLEDAEAEGNVIGHSQKLARARIKHSARLPDRPEDEAREQPILRRDFNSLDGTGEQLPVEEEEEEETETTSTEEDRIPPNSTLHFLTIMRYNEDMVDVRQAMNDVGFTSRDGSISHESILDDELDIHGIHEYILATRRGNFLMPPLSLRSLPPARGREIDIALLPFGDENVVDLDDDFTPVAITTDHVDDPKDMLHVGFGEPTAVNQLGAASPVDVDREDVDDDIGGEWILWFETSELGLTTDDGHARLLMYDGAGEPIFGQVSVDVVQ